VYAAHTAAQRLGYKIVHRLTLDNPAHAPKAASHSLRRARRLGRQRAPAHRRRRNPRPSISAARWRRSARGPRFALPGTGGQTVAIVMPIASPGAHAEAALLDRRLLGDACGR